MPSATCADHVDVGGRPAVLHVPRLRRRALAAPRPRLPSPATKAATTRAGMPSATSPPREAEGARRRASRHAARRRATPASRCLGGADCRGEAQSQRAARKRPTLPSWSTPMRRSAASVDYLRCLIGQLDNTAIVLLSDNGASGEGGATRRRQTPSPQHMPHREGDRRLRVGAAMDPHRQRAFVPALSVRLGAGVEHAAQVVQEEHPRRGHSRRR